MKKNSLIQLKNKQVIDLNKVIYIKSDGHYAEFFCIENNQRIISRSSLKALTTRLPAALFVRVQRSYIINLNYVVKFNKQHVILQKGKKIPLSRNINLNDHIAKIHLKD